MLCFEFADGSGGSGWPVDSAWRPPGDPAIALGSPDPAGPSPTMLAVALIALLALLASILAFRRGR